MALKDNFSLQSKDYAKFRPGYPKEMFDFLVSLCAEHATAWDCGTGNGQVASELANHFQQVIATDISQNQINHAIQKPSIKYLVEKAEHTSFHNSFFDLITVAQAIHWFEFDKFYNEVNRTLKPGGIFAVIGYPLCTIDPKVDAALKFFYENTLNGYWDPERRYLDENYTTIPFPFNELKTPAFSMQYKWSRDDFMGFLNTWSGVQHYVKKNQRNPVEEAEESFKSVWNNEEMKTVTFPVLLRITRKV